MEETMSSQFEPACFAAVRGACMVLAACASVGSVLAQSVPKDGNYDFVSCYSGTASEIAFSKTHVAGSTEFVGSNRTTPPGGPFDMTAFRCVGTYALIDGKYSTSAYCEGVDKDGDKIMTRNTTEGPRGKQEVIAGTGKYEGMVRSGITEPLGQFPSIKPGTFTACNRQTGTYKMK